MQYKTRRIELADVFRVVDPGFHVCYNGFRTSGVEMIYARGSDAVGYC